MRNLTIHFKNASAMCLYSMEMEGQISDGKYENSRPNNHWEWIGDVANLVVDGNIGVESSGCYNSRFNWASGHKKYNLNEWYGYIINKWRKDKDTDYIWASRIIAFGKFGKIYSNIDYNTLQKLGEVRIFLEELQVLIENGETDANKLFNKITDFTTTYWRQSYYEKCKDYITLDFVKKYLDLKYDVKEVKEDIKSMEMSINNDINFFKF